MFSGSPLPQHWRVDHAKRWLILAWCLHSSSQLITHSHRLPRLAIPFLNCPTEHVRARVEALGPLGSSTSNSPSGNVGLSDGRGTREALSSLQYHLQRELYHVTHPLRSYSFQFEISASGTGRSSRWLRLRTLRSDCAFILLHGYRSPRHRRKNAHRSRSSS